VTDRKPFYADEATKRAIEFATGDTLPKEHAATGTLFDDASHVPFTPRYGLVATQTQAAIEELVARLSGGRRQAYFPYVISRQYDRIPRIHRTGNWVAGEADGAEVLHTHGTWGHLYPFGVFTAYNDHGTPHRDHDRMFSASGPDLVTNTSTLSSDAHTAGFAKFVRTGGDWVADGYQAGKWVYSLGWAGPSNGRFDVSAVSTLELTVKDPADQIVTEAAAANHEVRGTGGSASGHNGYEDGVLLLAGGLDVEERVRFRAAGTLLNTTTADTFIELCLEPNPPLDIPGTSQFTGANRMRMLTGELGATWTGTKRVLWECEFYRGHANTGDEYHYDWSIAIQDVLSVGGHGHVTGGFNFKSLDAYLCPRFRVDRIANLDTYDATFQDGTQRLLTFQKYDVEPVH
jgi:hypothetical protein